jgi:hypothetical protein
LYRWFAYQGISNSQTVSNSIFLIKLYHRVPSDTSKKESDDDDAAAARTNPRFSPGTLRAAGKRYTQRPSGRNGDTRKRHRIGVETTWISPDPKKPHLGQSVALYQTCHPPKHATTVLQSLPSPHLGPSYEASKTDKKELLRGQRYSSMREEQPPPPTAVADQMQHQVKPGPHWNGRARIRPVKLHCHTAAGMPPSPPPPPRAPTPPSARSAATAPEAACPDLDGAPRAQIWARRASPATLRQPGGRRQPRLGDQPVELRLPRRPAAKRSRLRHQDHLGCAPTVASQNTPPMFVTRHAATPCTRGRSGRRSRHHTGNAQRPAPAAAERGRGEGKLGGGGLWFFPARPRGGETGARQRVFFSARPALLAKLYQTPCNCGSILTRMRPCLRNTQPIVFNTLISLDIFYQVHPTF